MYLSKHKSGYYYVYFNDIYSNRRRSVSTKTKLKSEALKFISRFESDIKQKIEHKVEPILLKDFINKFLLYSANRHTYKTSKGHKTSLMMLKEYFGNVPLTDLTHTKMKDYIERRLRKTSHYAARRDLINLSSSFNKAVEDNYLLENPFKNIKRIKIPEKQPNFFSKEEYDKLLEGIEDKGFRLLVEIAANTGLRSMELLTLEWNQVNLEERFITLNNHKHITKGKRVRTIPLNNRAMQVLCELVLVHKGNFVFNNDGLPLRQDYVTKKFKKYVKNAKVNPQLNFHSLRHSFASWLVQKGVGIYQVSKLLGHADIKTTQIYAHVRAEDLRESINTLNN